MDYTDRHFRRFLRLISRSTVLYTEMVPDVALLFGQRARFLDFDAMEHPLVLQVGGSDADRLAECARLAEAWGYDAINLNCGCPSERVEEGRFGACLMATPGATAAAVRKMSRAVSIPVTVKHRLGIRGRGSEGRERYEHVAEFMDACADAGCRHFIVHARIAVLGGLNPAQNRSIPPIDYESVYRLKADFPQLTIELNGGVRSLDEAAAHLKYVDGVMIGRAACDDPWIFHDADSRFAGRADPASCRKDVVRALLADVERAREDGIALHHVLRHAANLFRGMPGARRYRRFLSERVFPARFVDAERLHALVEEALCLVDERGAERTAHAERSAHLRPGRLLAERPLTEPSVQ